MRDGIDRKSNFSIKKKVRRKYDKKKAIVSLTQVHYHDNRTERFRSKRGRKG